jgi:hypothetical protein
MAYGTRGRISVRYALQSLRSAELLAKDRKCQTTWFGFEQLVVNGWPIDLVIVKNETFVYDPLGVKAQRQR